MNYKRIHRHYAYTLQGWLKDINGYRVVVNSTFNDMSIYVKDYPKIIAKERPIYGSSRLGIMNKEVEFNLTGNLLSKSNSTIGIKEYELCDHLSNVSVVILDRKDCFNSVFKPIVKTYTDYYPFGYPISSRTDIVDYRYGFNGQDGDNEIYGDKLDYAFTYRMYDSRIGRFWSVDPLKSDYPWNSTYAFAENSPIAFLELEGLEKIYFWSQTKQKKVFSHVEKENVKEWVVVSTTLYNTFTYTFTNESKFNKWGSGMFDMFIPKPSEISSGALWEIMKEVFGDPSGSGLNTFDTYDNINFLLQKSYVDKLDNNYSFGVVIGSFKNKKNAEKFVKEKYPQAIILKYVIQNKDNKTSDVTYRVISNIDKYSNFVNVLDERNNRKEEGFNDVWMTIIPNKALKSGAYSSKDGSEKIENLFKKQ